MESNDDGAVDLPDDAGEGGVTCPFWLPNADGTEIVGGGNSITDSSYDSRALIISSMSALVRSMPARVEVCWCCCCCRLSLLGRDSMSGPDNGAMSISMGEKISLFMLLSWRDTCIASHVLKYQYFCPLPV